MISWEIANCFEVLYDLVVQVVDVYGLSQVGEARAEGNPWGFIHLSTHSICTSHDHFHMPSLSFSHI